MAGRGIDGVQVSLYGPDAVTHDAMTGIEGSFDQALGCMRFLRDLGVRVRAAVTPTSGMVDSIGEIKTLLEEEEIGVALGVYMSPRRDGDTSPQDLAVDEAGLRKVLKVFPPDSRPRMAGCGLDERPCGAGAGTVSVDPHGIVYPCLPLRLPVGSLREEGIREIWRNSRRLAELRSLTIGDLKDCPQCERKERCNRCTGFAVAEGKSIIDHCSFDCLQAGVL